MVTLMKRRVSIFAIVLLLCMPLMILNIPTVRADAEGIGKFLTIKIVGEGSVTATKIASGETWDFYQNGTEKVGAGTVLLEAFAQEGWEFIAWTGDLTSNATPEYFKTQKYSVVTAIFEEKTYTITASAEGNGTINPFGNVTVQYGADQTFVFTPDVGNHISAIVVDGVYLSSFAQNYTFCSVTANHTIRVIFSTDGTATVHAGFDISAFLSPGVIMTFDQTDAGRVSGEDMHAYYPVGTMAVAWKITITFAFGNVTVILHYDDTGLLINETDLRLIRGDSIEAIRSDVNNDLVVDGTDVSIVANAVKQSYWYDPFLDINNDGNVTEADIHIVNANKGTILEDITDGIDTDLNIIWGTTDQSSIFGVHRG